MPEMLQFCGQRFRVDKLAVKLCDTIGSTGMYRMRNAVHLEGVRCDGQAHGGCQAGCLIYWKEAWLKRVPADGYDPPDPAPEPAQTAALGCTHGDATGGNPQGRHLAGGRAVLLPGHRAAAGGANPGPPWDVSQYVRDVRSGNAGLLATIRAVAIGVFNEYQDLSRRFLPRPLRIKDGSRLPFIEGDWRRPRTTRSTCSPVSSSGSRASRRSSRRSTQQQQPWPDVRPRDVVVLRPARPECCGESSGLIDERTGKLLRIKRPCIVLEDVTCRGAYHRCCPRADYPYWREIWLERVE